MKQFVETRIYYWVSRYAEKQNCLTKENEKRNLNCKTNYAV